MFSRDGKRVLTASWDKTARLWDVETGKEIRQFQGHTDMVWSAVFSGDGKRVLTASADKTARLWDAETGKEIRQFQGHAEFVWSAVFSGDGKRVLTAGDRTARLWDVETGKEIRQFQGHTGFVYSAVFSGDGNRVLTASLDKTARLWDVETGKEIRQFQGHVDFVCSAVFSGDGKRVLTASDDKTARLWDVETGKEIRQFQGHTAGVRSAAFSGDGKRALTASFDKTARLWDVETGKEIRQFRGHADFVKSAVFSGDGKRMLTASDDKTARLWDVEAGKEIRQFRGHAHYVISAVFSGDGKRVLTASSDKTARLWDVETGKEIRRFQGHTHYVISAVFSGDGKRVLTASWDDTARLWDVETGKEIRTFQGHAHYVCSAVFSGDGKRVLTASSDKTARLWDVETGKEIRQFEGHVYDFSSAVFSWDGKRVLTAGHKTARLWDVETGKEIRTFQGHDYDFNSAVFSWDGQRVLAAGNKTAQLWDVQTGKEIRKFQGHAGLVLSAVFSGDCKRVLTASSDNTARLWDVETGKELCKLISFRDGSWAVADAEGRFDASHGGDVDGLHWVVGNEPIALAQLKERYYDPGLLAKYMGFNKEPSAQGRGFSRRRSLSHRHAGPTDRRPQTAHRSCQSRRRYRQGPDLRQRQGIARRRPRAGHRSHGKRGQAHRRSGERAIAQARGRQQDRDCHLEPGRLSLQPQHAVDRQGAGTTSSAQPELYAIVAGVSDYASPSLKLKYAAKDAEDMAQALELGAKRLLGVDKVHLTLLTTSKDSKNPPPTRANLQKAFEQTRQAKPGDVLIVYLAGHGMAIPGSDDLYCYLTSEARGTDLSDPAIREQYAVTSTELTDWIKKIPALKQVMILDTCAAGAAARKLTEQRQISGDQIRAIDRLKDRTGFHILMGCASDKVSYEATQFEQGLLTHALLKGMRGAALRQEEFVDVANLFQYAADEVPQLARNIGGIQKPLIAAPRGVSFDVGQLTREDKAKVRLAISKPLVLRPSLTNADEFDGDDTLGLTALLRRKLGDNSGLAGRGTTVYVNADEMPGAIRPGGKYVIAGNEGEVADGASPGRQNTGEFSSGRCHEQSGGTDQPPGRGDRTAGPQAHCANGRPLTRRGRQSGAASSRQEMGFKRISAGFVPLVGRHLALLASEHDDLPPFALDATFPIASSCRLDYRLQRGQFAHKKREVHINAGFDQLGTDDITWLTSCEQEPDNL